MAIPHIPCLRLGDPYVSLNKIEVNDYRDGTPKATVSQVNAGVVRRDLQRIDEARAALRKFTTAVLIEIGAKAGDIFLNGKNIRLLFAKKLINESVITIVEKISMDRLK